MIKTIESFRLPREGTVLVVVDVQQRLVPAMDPPVVERTVRNIRRLLEGARILGLPVLFTEQYPAGLGPTIPELEPAQAGPPLEKITFGCGGEPGFLPALRARGAKRVLLTGMEAHVCVYQTLLDLLGADLPVHLVRDAVCSRHRENYQAALENASLAGAVLTTTEMALFQLLERAGTPQFKAISALVKEG